MLRLADESEDRMICEVTAEQAGLAVEEVERVRNSLNDQGFTLISTAGLAKFLDDVESIVVSYIDVLANTDESDARIDNALDALEEVALDPTVEPETRVDAALSVLTVYDLYN